MGRQVSFSKRVRFAAETVVAGTLLGLARWLPRPALVAIGESMGEAAFRLDRKHTRVAIENLATAFGDALSPSERRRIARACWRHYGRITADAAAFPRLRPTDIGTSIRYEGLEAVKAAYAEGRGVLVISGHFGHWELTAYMQGFLVLPMTLITKPMENPKLERMLAALRLGSGNRVVAKDNAMREAVRSLARSVGVAVMIDQDARGAGIFVPFFGRLSSSIPTVGMLHLRTGAAVVATFSYPEADGGWRIVYERMTFPGLSGDRDRDVRRITEETTTLLEARIRQRPELWMWMHRRWKTPPPATNHRS